MGLIANPASGRDIRRLVAQATTVGHQGKMGLLRRVLVGLGAAGIRQVVAMPDGQNLAVQAWQAVARLPDVPALALLDMPVTGEAHDSEIAAHRLVERGADCLVVLGGDGTARVVSKGAGETPLVLISTGTNNVLPRFVEGSLAGLAAGLLARGQLTRNEVALRHKWLAVELNGQPHDRALVDIAVTAGRFVGARALWDLAALREIIVTRADPVSIGISAIAAMVRPIAPDEPRGAYLRLSPEASRRVLAAWGPGMVASVGVAAARTIVIGETLSWQAQEHLLLALDGERETLVHSGDEVRITLRADGPWVVDVARAMARAVQLGLLTRGGLSS